MLSIFLKLLSRMFSNLTIADNVRVEKEYDRSRICLEFLKGKRRHEDSLRCEGVPAGVRSHDHWVKGPVS